MNDLEQGTDQGTFESVPALVHLFQKHECFAVDPSGKPPGKLIDLAHLITGEGVFPQQTGGVKSMLQIVHGLFFGQRGHENFIDHRSRRQPLGDFCKPLTHTGIGKQDDVSEFSFSG